MLRYSSLAIEIYWKTNEIMSPPHLFRTTIYVIVERKKRNVFKFILKPPEFEIKFWLSFWRSNIETINYGILYPSSSKSNSTCSFNFDSRFHIHHFELHIDMWPAYNRKFNECKSIMTIQFSRTLVPWSLLDKHFHYKFPLDWSIPRIIFVLRSECMYSLINSLY